MIAREMPVSGASRASRAAVFGISLALALVGCTSSSPPAENSSYCLPHFTIEPAEPSAGDSITITADGCEISPPSSGWDILVAPVGRPSSGVSTTVTDVVDGAFTVTVELPETFPSGEAFVSIDNWDYSPCDDTVGNGNGNGSCASASADFTVR